MPAEWFSRCCVVAAACCNVAFAQDVRSPRPSSRDAVTSEAGTIAEIDRLLALGRKPEQITRANVEGQFRLVLARHPCDAMNWSCGWVNTSTGNATGVTHLSLPNPSRGKYRTGGSIMMELPKEGCIAPEEISARVLARPSTPAEPPALLSYTPGDEPFEPETMQIYAVMPGMPEQVRLTSWVLRGCVVRLELEALNPK